MKAFNLNWIKLSPSNNDAGKTYYFPVAAVAFKKEANRNLKWWDIPNNTTESNPLPAPVAVPVVFLIHNNK